MTRTMTIRLAALLAAATATATTAHAQADVFLETFNRGLMAQCPKVVAQMTARKELAAALELRPVDSNAVCACTSAAFSRDAKIQGVLQQGPQALTQRMQSERFKSYLFTRLLGSVLGCLSSEFDQVLDIASPD